MKCKKCGNKILADEVGMAKNGTMLYDVWTDDSENLNWEQKEFVGNGKSETIYHQTCLAKIADYDEDLLKKIIKEGK